MAERAHSSWAAALSELDVEVEPLEDSAASEGFRKGVSHPELHGYTEDRAAATVPRTWWRRALPLRQSPGHREGGGGIEGQLSVVEFLAPKGFGPPLHRHNYEDDLFVVRRERNTASTSSVHRHLHSTDGPVGCSSLDRRRIRRRRRLRRGGAGKRSILRDVASTHRLGGIGG